MQILSTSNTSEVLAAARRNGSVTVCTQGGVVRVGHDHDTQTYSVAQANRPTMRGLAFEVQSILANLSSFV